MRLYTDASFGNPVDSTTWTAYGPPNVGGGVVEFTQILQSANLVLNSNGYTTTFTNDGQVNIPGGLTAFTDIGTDGNIYAVNFNASGNISATGLVVTPPQALADLTLTAGARAFANDANLVATGNFGAQVANGGSNVVPVWSDGANWYIG
jgi:hypothetical protein